MLGGVEDDPVVVLGDHAEGFGVAHVGDPAALWDDDVRGDDASAVARVEHRRPGLAGARRKQEVRGRAHEQQAHEQADGGERARVGGRQRHDGRSNGRLHDVVVVPGSARPERRLAVDWRTEAQRTPSYENVSAGSNEVSMSVEPLYPATWTSGVTATSNAEGAVFVSVRIRVTARSSRRRSSSPSTWARAPANGFAGASSIGRLQPWPSETTASRPMPPRKDARSVDVKR